MNTSIRLSSTDFDEMRDAVAGCLSTARELYENGEGHEAAGYVIEAVWMLEDFADEAEGKPPRPRGGLFD